MIRNTVLNIFGETWPTIVITIVIVASMRIVYLIKYHHKIIVYKELLTLLFIIYILCLFYVVTFQDISWNTSNFILFKEMFRYEFGSHLFIKNVIGNVLLFIPYGFFAAYYLKLKNVTSILGLSFLVSTTIETTQLLIGRVFDIDDIILNVFGGLFGFYIYFLLDKLNKKLPSILKNPVIYTIIMVSLLVIVVIYLSGFIELGV